MAVGHFFSSSTISYSASTALARLVSSAFASRGPDRRRCKDRLEYAQWWNENGILGFKVESLQSVLNIRALVKPGITYIDIGGMDLMFDIESHDHPTLKSVEDCREFMQQELEGIDVRFS